MPGYKASRTQYSDVSAKKWASKDYQDLTPEKVRDWRRPRIAWKSKAEWDEAKSTWCETSGDQIAWDSGCRKVAGSVEHDPGHVAGGKRLVKLVANLLRDDDIQAKMDAEGFVSIQCLLKAKPVLNECGTAKSIVTAIEEQARHVRLDKARRRVRLENLHEEVRAEASAFMRQQPFGVVPIVSFLSMPVLVRTLPETASREGLLRQALEHPDSELEVQGTFVSWRPRASKLRQVVEQLFDDTQESRLQVKLAQSATGEIPLAWIVGKYADRFGFSGLQDARVAEAVAEELAKALEDSKALVVDRRRLTIRARQRNPEVAPEDHDDVAGPSQECQEIKEGAERRSSTRAATQLRQLLDFYFDPFTLQHNRYLLDLILKRARAPQEKGPWLAEALHDCHFTFEDLKGLGRIQSALAKLQPSDWAAELGSLKHLTCDAGGSLYLRTQLEVRNFVHADDADKDVAASAVRYLSAAREQREQAPPGMVSVLSYSIADAFNDQSPQGQQRQAKVKRQVLVYHTDLICLQGIDVAQKRGASLASSLTEEGYSFVSCSVDGEANSIFWDRSRWEMVGKEEGAVLSVSLRPLEDPAVTIRALCFKAKACPEPTRFFSSTDEPLLVCTDLSWLGGVQAAGILEDLMGLPSVTEEVLGTEVAAHMPAPPGLSQDCELAPVRCATGLNRLRFPDAVFFHEMAAVAALSGHSEGYMASMPPEDVVHQFPCFRLPIVAAFDWRAGRAGSDEERELLDIGLPPGLF